MRWYGRSVLATVLFTIAFLGQAAAGQAATPVLPNLDMASPSNFIVKQVGSSTLLAFDSTAYNIGSGNLRLLGTRPNTGVTDMTVNQLVDQSDGTRTTVPNVGFMRFISHGHQHWHFLEFEHFELRNVSGAVLRNDQKQGFCLFELSVNECGSDQPGLLQIPMGIGPGGYDYYSNATTGNSVDVTTLANGEYLLVQRVNPSGRLQETTLADNASSARIRLRTIGKKNRKVEVIATCSNTPTC